MKSVVTVLAIASIALNLVLLGLFIAGRTHSPDTLSPAPVARPAATVPSEPDVTGQVWAQLLADEDLPAMVKRLRESGFPPEVVRAIVAAQIREQFAARMKAVDPQAESRAYWKNSTIDPRVQVAQRQLYREQQKLLRDLLGADADPQDMVSSIFQGRRLDSIPADKVDDVRRLLRDYEDARSDAFSSFTGGSLSAETQRKLKEVDKAHQDALAQLLGPADLEAYNLRNSDTARQMRGNLVAFNPSEQEFRSLYKLQAEFDARFSPMYGMPGPEEQRQRSDAQRELNEQIKAFLGPMRGVEYERSTDFSYRQTSQLVARLELPPETTAKIWDVKQDIEQRAMALRRDSALDAAARNQQLTALAEESTAKLAPLLGGARGIDAFKQYGGYWLNNLVPRPASGPNGSGTMILTPAR